MIIDVECPLCNGTGEVCGVNPSRRSRFVSDDDLSPDDYTIECPRCLGDGCIAHDLNAADEAICRLLETLDAERAAHAQFRQEVSDRVEAFNKRWTGAGESHSDFMSLFSRFILPKPVDPLVEAVRDCGYATLDAIEPEFVADLRAALAKRGLKLVEVGDAD